MIRARRAAAAALLAALAACAAVPEAAPERDAEAKRFDPRPGAATLYVYRDDFPGNAEDDDSVLFVNGRLIGATLAGTYFRVDLRSGEQRVHGTGHDQGSLTLRIGSGEIAYVSLNVSNGESAFRQRDAATGQRAIRRCCVLLENWRPGQRPLLR